MAIGTSQGAAPHFLVTTHTLAVICALESQIRPFLIRAIVIDNYRLMTLAAGRCNTFWAVVMAFGAIAGNFGMLGVRKFNRSVERG